MGVSAAITADDEEVDQALLKSHTDHLPAPWQDRRGDTPPSREPSR